jgi:Spy/CpxP family protein refolding chaperone
MKLKLSVYFVIFFLCGAAIGLWIGHDAPQVDISAVEWRQVVQGELDQFYTDVLNISAQQKTQLMGIEREYRDRRDHLTDQMHQANVQLADVIEKEGYESQKIEPLVVNIHTAMGQLQKLALTHLADIEKVLLPEQAKKLKQSAVARLRQN